MANQLSGIAIIICIAFGSLTGIVLFIFAKRQIMRFALKSRSGPHVPVAFDAPKRLRHEIDRRLSVARNIKYHPRVLKDSNKKLFQDLDSNHPITPKHIYRMKVVEDVRELCIEISSRTAKKFSLPPNEAISSYLIRLYKKGILSRINTEMLHKFLSYYEHARYEPKDFTHVEYCLFMECLQYILKGLPEPDENDTSKSCSQLDENLEKDNKKLLLKRLSPKLNANNKQKVTCETPV